MPLFRQSVRRCPRSKDPAMRPPPPAIWGIHSGGNHEAEPMFRGGTVALGWGGSTNEKGRSRDEVKKEIEGLYPNEPKSTRASWAGSIYRFASVMKAGDLIVYHSPSERTIRVGRVGEYKY